MFTGRSLFMPWIKNWFLSEAGEHMQLLWLTQEFLILTTVEAHIAEESNSKLISARGRH